MNNGNRIQLVTILVAEQLAVGDPDDCADSHVDQKTDQRAGAADQPSNSGEVARRPDKNRRQVATVDVG